MRKEIVRPNNKEKPNGLELSRSDIFVSDEHSAFTVVGSHLYGLFVVHKEAIREALNNRDITSEMRLKQMIGEETEEQYLEAEEVWERKIPRDEITSNSLTEQLTIIIKEQLALLSNGSSLKKR